MPFTAPAPSGRRSFWSSGKPRLDKKAISRPREYVWPEFVAPPPRSARDAEVDRRLAEGAAFGALGVPLISLRDAKSRDGIVRAEALDWTTPNGDDGRHQCLPRQDWGRGLLGLRDPWPLDPDPRCRRGWQRGLIHLGVSLVGFDFNPDGKIILTSWMQTSRTTTRPASPPAAL
ncbi:hypothetical protein C2E23DRAFT_862719 [Lenzites betulinus]|nr:hypothetical protein C2E23DRAFT_862719 [Lenzites betulinus]